MRLSLRFIETLVLSTLTIGFSTSGWGCAFCRAKANEAMRNAAPTQSVAAAGARGAAGAGGTTIRGKIAPTLLTWDDKYLEKPLQVDRGDKNPQRMKGASDISEVDGGYQ